METHRHDPGFGQEEGYPQIAQITQIKKGRGGPVV